MVLTKDFNKIWVFPGLLFRNNIKILRKKKWFTFTYLKLCMRMPSQSQLWSRICEGILSVAVGLFGLVGNVATIFVLTRWADDAETFESNSQKLFFYRPAFRETFHKLLICLAFFDSLFIGEYFNKWYHKYVLKQFIY